MVETPLMKQYNHIKARYPDALLLFRVGDFYETFGSDAVKASGVLGIVLTKRANGSGQHIELAGFPHHSIDNYLPKLVRAGYRVAICDQLEDPKLTKKIVKRGITEIVTPGVSYNDKVLEQKHNNFLAAVHVGEAASGIAFLDISTGEFLVAQGSNDYIDKTMQSFVPAEVIVQKNRTQEFKEKFGNQYYINTLDEWVFKREFAFESLTKHFETISLKGFGVEDLPEAVIAAGAIMHYLKETHHDKDKHISSISRIEEDNYVWLDRFTIRNLEVLYSTNENAKTLIQVIDNTLSPMGGRLLKRWVALPLKHINAIQERLDIVDFFISNDGIAESIRTKIKECGDLERLISKVAVRKVSPREVMQISRALVAINDIKILCKDSSDTYLKSIGDRFSPCSEVQARIEREINPEPPVSIQKGEVIRSSVSAELDELRSIMRDGKSYILGIKDKESIASGISSLKIGFNNVFGYYLEVTNAHKDKVPDRWMRKQTLTNAERYITEELKEYEAKILGAEDRVQTLEYDLFDALLQNIAEYIEPIQLNASLIARLDVLLSFATASQVNGYIKPIVDNSNYLDIKDGRHPVIERQLPDGDDYISNDLFLDDERQQILIITGPNMSGKSAFLRQNALIVLMAQIGCFVPASYAHIGVVDKIFTRVGASDNISSGESTFMVEMNETSSILNNLSDRSLIILDEIGRGTSTYDGISIAWSITEFLHSHCSFKPKVLFATHYHELNEMAESMPRIKNFHVTVREHDNKVIFLRKIVAGGSEHSFGIQVAKMAGMPQWVIARAEKILVQLEGTHNNDTMTDKPKRKSKGQDSGMQLSFFQLDDPILTELRDVIVNTDIDKLTPIEALIKLHEIKRKLK